MRSVSVIASCALLAAAAAEKLNIPQVDQLVNSALQSLSQYTDYHGPKEGASSNNGQGHGHNGSGPDTSYWLADFAHQGYAAFNPNASTYKVFRNVKDYGAKGMDSRASLFHAAG